MIDWLHNKRDGAQAGSDWKHFAESSTADFDNFSKTSPLGEPLGRFDNLVDHVTGYEHTSQRLPDQTVC